MNDNNSYDTILSQAFVKYSEMMIVACLIVNGMYNMPFI